MKKVGLSIILSIFMVALAACSGTQTSSSNSDKPIVLTMGTKMPENNVESKGVTEFARLVEEKTAGKLKIDVFFHEQLGTESEQIENVISGAQDIYFETMTYYLPYVKDFNIHSLPFLFKDNEEYLKFLQSDIQKKMEDDLINKVGIRFINSEKNFIRGPYRVLVSTKPVQKLEDLKGLNLRLAESETAIKAWSALGANTTVIPWSETYLALKQGVVNAATSPISTVTSMNFHEVAKHVTVTYEYPQSLVMAMNEDKFQSLPKELQKSLVEAANEAGEIGSKYINEETESVINKLEEAKVQVYEVDLSPWQEKMDDVYKDLIKNGFLNEELLNEIKDWKAQQ
ncbi:TRAP transporter substrate-binding protein [Cytobacillus sp. FJAT-53684]|uniref:TRAP transporter substrate-binding protein n=1 Tax=Cytobacillus mangrovibacter TaxID=3299024 RepID=A0ABW6K2P7_9BACI